MRIAFIAHYFPPDGGAGAQRPASFARHLPAEGIEAVFFSREVKAEERSFFDPEDPSLLPWVKAAQIERLAWSATTLDAWFGRVAAAVKAEHARNPFALVAATCPPFYLAGFVTKVAAEIGVPALVDLRDPWALDGVRVFKHRAALRREQETMRHALRAAARVVANTPEAQARIKYFLGPDGPPVDFVTNGYEEEDFAGFGTGQPSAEGPLRLHFSGHFLANRLIGIERMKEALRIALGGRAEPIRAAGRGPGPLVGALELLERRDPGLFGRLEVHVAGRQQEQARRIIERSRVAARFVFHGELPHAGSLDLLKRADILFLPLHGVAGGGRSRIVPGKAYEYFAARRPIVAALPEGDARDFTRLLGAGPVCDPCDPSAICEAIREAAGWRLPQPAPAELAGFSRRALAAKFAVSLREAAGDPGGSQ